jgi:hypothetical protein
MNIDSLNPIIAPTSGEYEQPLGASRQPFMKAVSRPLPDVLSEQLKGKSHRHCYLFLTMQ